MSRVNMLKIPKLWKNVAQRYLGNKAYIFVQVTAILAGHDFT